VSCPAARIRGASRVDSGIALLDVGDFSSFIDHESGPVRYACILIQNPVRLTDFTLGKIAEDRERQVVLCGEFLLRRRIIGADSKDLRVVCLEFGNTSLVCLDLLGSATGKRGGKESQYDRVLAPEIGKLHFTASGGVQREIRRFVTYFQMSLAGLNGLSEQADGCSHSDQRQRQQLHKTSFRCGVSRLPSKARLRNRLKFNGRSKLLPWQA
jgi:hypothetical protein